MNTMKQTIILLLVAVLLAATLTPVALAAEVCYPTAVEQSEDGGEIRKVYDLTPDQDPAGISRSDFEQNGIHYTLTDLLKQEMPEYQERSHTEEVTLSSKSKDMETILSLLPQPIPLLNASREAVQRTALSPRFVKENTMRSLR